MQQLKQAQTYTGRIITVAAMIDDVLSLVIFAMLLQLAKSEGGDDAEAPGGGMTTPAANVSTMADDGGSSTEIDAWLIAQPIVVSLLFLIGGVILIRWTPLALAWMTQRCPRLVARELLAGILVLCAALTLAAGYSGTTFLLGSFVAGMCFADVPKAIDAVAAQSSVFNWLASIFFASLGLVIPVGTLFEPTALGYGFLYAFISFIGKFCVGIFMGNVADGLVVGFAMLGRGGLGCVAMAVEGGLLTRF